MASPRHGSAFLAKTVGDVMTAPAITVTTDTLMLSALSLMTKRRIRHLPVVENDRLTGFVSIGDLVKYRIEKIEAEAAAMRDYIQHGLTGKSCQTTLVVLIMFFTESRKMP